MLKRFRIIGLCLVAALAMSVAGAVAAGTASAKEPTWWVCKTGTPQDAECPTGETETELTAGERLSFVSKHKAGTAKRLKVTVLGTAVVIECAKEIDKGEIIGGRPGKDTVTSDVFEECVVVAPAGCEVVTGQIALTTPIATTLRWKHKGQFKEPATETEQEAKEALDQFVPLGGPEGTFTEFELTKCSNFLFNGKHVVRGEALALLRPVAKKVQVAELEFPCSLITKYWTGDTPNGKSTRVEHTIKPLELVTPLGPAVLEEFCETKEVELVNKKRFGVFPAEKIL